MQIDPDYMKKQKVLTEEDRKSVVLWMAETGFSLQLHRPVTLLAIEILDLVCSVKFNFTLENYKSLAGSCIFLADMVLSVTCAGEKSWKFIKGVDYKQMANEQRKILRLLNFEILGTWSFAVLKRDIDPNCMSLMYCVLRNFENLKFFPNKEDLLSKCEHLDYEFPEVWSDEAYSSLLETLKSQKSTFNPPALPKLLKLVKSVKLHHNVSLTEAGAGVCSAVWGFSEGKTKLAQKIFDKEQDWNWIREILTYKQLQGCSFVMPILEIILPAYPRSARLIMPFYEQSLWDLLTSRKLLVEEIKQIIWSVASGVKEVHEKGVIWRDLKPMNILVKQEGQMFAVFLADFNLAASYRHHMTPVVQTCCYRAPEVFEFLDYTEKIDIWSLGVLFGELITGGLLFRETAVDKTDDDSLLRMAEFLDNKSLFELYVKKLGSEKQKVRKRTRVDKRIEEFEELGKDLMFKMLTVDPEKRISASGILEHPWFEEYRGPVK